MHTAQELSSSDFAIEVAGRSASLQDLFPGFGERDRAGVVVRRPCGAVGASTLLLAAVTAFYDIQREKSEDFFIYPDYFLFHADRLWGDHGMLDVWPSHKEVVIADEPEELLRAVNDRAITRLVVQDGPPRPLAFERESLASARQRIVTALAYSASGRVSDPDVRLAGNGVTESYVAAVLDRSEGIARGDRDELAAGRDRLHEEGLPVETYRRLTLDEALARL
ncbi:MAG: hypothetical protein JO240_11870 [Solirubrobacterales bacterium]|nr:hypothetical protein [Solirubrobacterales bacterium]